MDRMPEPGLPIYPEDQAELFSPRGARRHSRGSEHGRDLPKSWHIKATATSTQAPALGGPTGLERPVWDRLSWPPSSQEASGRSHEWDGLGQAWASVEEKDAEKKKVHVPCHRVK